MTDTDTIFATAIIATLLVLLAVAVITDLKSHRIPNILLAPALSLALLFHTMHGGPGGLMMAIGGLALGLAMLMPLYLVGGMGAGDVKLLGVVGCFLGPWGAVIAGMGTMMVGAVFGIVVIAWRHIRLVPAIHAAQMPSPSAGESHTSADLSLLESRNPLTHIAYAPAIAVGTVTALWYIDFLPERLLG